MLSELDIEDRRALDALAGVVDEGLDLAEQCGWRYALAYLISERVPPNVIQRLLSGGGRVRHKRSLNEPGTVFHDHSFGWTGRNRDEMLRLFEALRQRRAAESSGANDVPLASRASVSPEEKD